MGPAKLEILPNAHAGPVGTKAYDARRLVNANCAPGMACNGLVITRDDNVIRPHGLDTSQKAPASDNSRERIVNRRLTESINWKGEAYETFA